MSPPQRSQHVMQCRPATAVSSRLCYKARSQRPPLLPCSTTARASMRTAQIPLCSSWSTVRCVLVASQLHNVCTACLHLSDINCLRDWLAHSAASASACSAGYRLSTCSHRGRQGGDLRRAMNLDEEGQYNWAANGKVIALDIARGLHFLHSKGVVHRWDSSSH